MISVLTHLNAEHFLPKRAYGQAEVQLEIPLLLKGHASPMIAEMLFRSAYKEISQQRKENSTILISPEGTDLFYFKGEKESLQKFYQAFSCVASQMISGNFSNETFSIAKANYVEELRTVGVLDKANAIDQMTFDEAYQNASLAHAMQDSMGRLFEDIQVSSAELLTFYRNPLIANCSDNQLDQAEEDPYQYYYQLRLTPFDCKNIAKLINYLCMSKWDILKNKGKIKQLGDEIRVVYPLRFMGYIISNPSLKKKLKNNIKGTLFVWSNFIDGFGERMGKEKFHQTLDLYLPGFCQHLGVSEEEVRQFIEKENWEEFVNFLLKHC